MGYPAVSFSFAELPPQPLQSLTQPNGFRASGFVLLGFFEGYIGTMEKWKLLSCKLKKLHKVSSSRPQNPKLINHYYGVTLLGLLSIGSAKTCL